MVKEKEMELWLEFSSIHDEISKGLNFFSLNTNIKKKFKILHKADKLLSHEFLIHFKNVIYYFRTEPFVSELLVYFANLLHLLTKKKSESYTSYW